MRGYHQRSHDTAESGSYDTADSGNAAEPRDAPADSRSLASKNRPA